MSMMVHRHYISQNENKNMTTLADVTPTADDKSDEVIEHYEQQAVNAAQRRGRPPKNR